MSEKAVDYINALMLDFRELMIDLQDEGDQYREKLANLKSNNRNRAIAATINRPPPPPPQPRPLPPIRTRTRETPSTSSTISLRDRQNHQALVDQIRAVMSSSVSATTRGALIVLEGLDRVGKSTLAKKLVDHLERTRRPVTYCRFPDRTTQVGRLIDEFLTSSKKVDSHVMHLLFSANRWELAKRIRSTLFQGETVIVDRYSYSGIAYSSAKKDLTLKWCCDTERGLPRPDLVIYLELPRENQYDRPGFGDERYETREMQDLVRLQYERVMELSKETWLKINVENKNPDQVLGEIIMPVKRCLEACSTKELGTLDFFDPSQF